MRLEELGRGHYLVRWRGQVVMYDAPFNPAPPMDSHWRAFTTASGMHFIIDPWDCVNDVTDRESRTFYLRYNVSSPWRRLLIRVKEKLGMLTV